MNAAIVTARAGSKSIVDKNVYQLENGDALVAFPIRAAMDAQTVDRVYCSTDGAAIAAAARALGCEIIVRPDELGGDSVNHGDVIRHAVHEVDAAVEGLENIVLLLGNTVMIDGPLIDMCVGLLDEDSTLDSAMTVWQAADDHPYRAMEIHDGLLSSWAGKPANISTERQSYPDIYYYDQGVWAFRKGCVDRHGPLSPWWWMGERCRPVVRTWTTGRDVHTHFDILFAESYLARYKEFLDNEERRVERPAGR
jgi:CMP-N-acetylneuraminic acid synthetase